MKVKHQAEPGQVRHPFAIGRRHNSKPAIVWLYPTLLAMVVLAVAGTTSLGAATNLTILVSILFVALLLRNTVGCAGLVVTLVLILGAVEPPRVAGVTVVNVGIGVCVMALAFQYFASRTPESKFNLPVWTSMMIAVIVASSSSIAGLSALSTPILTGLAVFFIAKRNPKVILTALGVAGLFHSGVGLIESLTHTSVIYTQWKDLTAADVGGVRRAASLVGDPNYLGLMLLCCSPGVLLIVKTWQPIFKYPLWIFYVSGFILTFSRGAFLGAVVALSLLALKKFPLVLRRPARLFAVLLVAAGGMALAVSTPVGRAITGRFADIDASTRSRTILQSAALELFQQNWLTGLGLGNLKEHLAPLAHALVPLNAAGVSAFLPQTDPLNTYLLLGAEGGILALTVALSVTLASILRSAKPVPTISAVIVGVAAAATTLDLVQSPVVWSILILALSFPSDKRPMSSVMRVGKYGKSASTLTADRSVDDTSISTTRPRVVPESG